MARRSRAWSRRRPCKATRACCPCALRLCARPIRGEPKSSPNTSRAATAALRQRQRRRARASPTSRLDGVVAAQLALDGAVEHEQEAIRAYRQIERAGQDQRTLVALEPAQHRAELLGHP